MSNIILQHWDSEQLPEWAVVASDSMRDYAAKCGAQYRLLHGTPFFDMLPEGFYDDLSMFEMNVQKLAFLSEEFDDYDQVCMYDMDMCATPWAKSVFGDLGSLSIWHVVDPSVVNSYRYSWMLSGAVYKFNLEQRRALRDVLFKIDFNDPATFSGAEARFFQTTWGDECVFAALLNHRDSVLDPASVKQIDVRFEAVLSDVHASNGRAWRPSKDSEVSVRHFMGLRIHQIVPTVHKWNGQKGVKTELCNLAHRWRYSRAWFSGYIQDNCVGVAKDWLRCHLVASSCLALENRVDVW